MKFALFPELLKLQQFKLRILILERFELEGFKTHGKKPALKLIIKIVNKVMHIFCEKFILEKIEVALRLYLAP